MSVAKYEMQAAQAEGVVTLRVSGELDLAVADRFEHDVAHYGTSATVGVDLDLADVDFIDSSGINALLRVRQSVVDGGRTFRLVSVSPIAQRALTLTGLDSLLGV
jgi:anti-anti-sigma factor